MITTHPLAMPNFKSHLLSNRCFGWRNWCHSHARPEANHIHELGFGNQQAKFVDLCQRDVSYNPRHLNLETLLTGQKIYIHTDQHSLKHLLDQCITMLKQQKWVAKLLGYEYEDGSGKQCCQCTLSSKSQSQL